MQNPTNRSLNKLNKPSSDGGATFATHESCFITTRVQSADSVVLGVQFPEPVFQHAVLAVTSIHKLDYVDQANSALNDGLQNFEIYIGNDPDYTMNAACSGGPHLVVGDAANYNAFGWTFGKEIWCNLEGQYMHLVADMTVRPTDYEASICALGIMGTKYELPAGASIDDTITVVCPVSGGDFLMPPLTSELIIGTTLASRVRLEAGSALPAFVTLVDESGSKLRFSSVGHSEGIFPANVEFFNSLSPVQSTLKKQAVAIITNPDLGAAGFALNYVTGTPLTQPLRM